MRAILSNLVWIVVLCAVGYLCATQVGKAGVQTTRCSTSTIHATIEIDGGTVVLRKVTICSNGEVRLVGRGVRCAETGTRIVKVQGRVVRTSGIFCR